MKYSNTVEYNISTKLDNSGLTKLQTQIKQVELTMQQMANRELLPAGRVEQAKTQLEGLSSALTKSFDSSLGMLDLAKFRNELQQSKVTADGLKSAFSMTGSQGVEAFGNLAKQIGNFNNGIEKSSSSLDKMFTTFSNTFRWGLVSSFFSQFMNAVHSSVDYVKELDDSLTQIMLVTDYNRDSMNEFAKSANEAAKAVSMTTTGMTNASLIFAQQGYDLGQSQELATLSAKLANASQQDTATTSDQITAYMNAYGLQDSMEELTQQMDNWAKIANVSAADVGELAQASQRAASMANTVGVSGEALAAQIATIESVTREAPEQIGNGLKTLYARFSDISGGGKDEDGVDLGKVTAQLDAIGVKVLDQFGNIRTMDDIMEDLMDVWADLDDTAKIAAAQSLAGKYQVNRFVALMDNRDMYEEYIGATGASAAGTLDQMNEEYADSIEGRSVKLQATLEGIFNNLFNTDSFYPFIDIAQKALDLIDNLTEAMGGGLPVLTALVSGFTQLFSTNIARGINDMMSNQQIAQTRQSNLANVKGALADTGLDKTGVGQYIQAGADRAGIMNGEQYNIYTDQLDNYITAATNAAKANEHLQDTYMLVAAAAGQVYEKGENLLFKDEEGINTSALIEELNKYKDSKALMSDLSKVDFSTAAESAKSFAKALSQLNGDLDRIKTKDRSGGDLWDIKQAEDDLYRINDALTDLGKAGALTKEDFGEMQKTVQKAFDQLATDGKISDDLAKDLDSMNVSIARFSEALQRIGPETLAKGPEAIAAAIAQEVAALEAEAAAAQGAEGVISNLDRQNVVNSVVTLTSSLGQLASAWMSIKNLGSILNDEDLSTGEKLLQTILNLSMVIGQVTSAFNQLSKAQKTISTLYDKINSATEKSAGALKKNADAAKQAAESSSKDNAEKTKGLATKAADTKITEEDAKANEKLKTSQNGAAAAAGKDAAAQAADAVAKTGATAATTSLTVAVGALKKALDLLTGPVGILITIFGMLAGAAWGAYQDNIEQMKVDAQTAYDEAKSNLEQIEALKDRTSAFGEKYEAFKDSGKGGKELIEEAESIAQAMKDAGAEEEASTIHLAALRAEARGTADDFNALANAVENSQSSVSETLNSEAIASADKLLATENTSAEEVIEHQEKIKAAQEELNNLDPLDAGYEAEKKRLEELISTLKDAKLAEEGLVDAANTKMNSTLDIGAQRIAEAEGQNMHVFQAQDAATARAGTEALTPGAMNWSSIDQYFKEISPEYAAIADEAERAAIAYEHMGTEAGKAAVEVGQLLLANESLTNNGGMQTTYDANTGQVLSQYELIGRQGIQTEMSDMGMDHDQQIQFLATLDENASESEIRTKLLDLKQKMQEGQDFEVALKASLNPEQLDEMVKNQINAYEPTDEDVDADQFKSMANYLHDADESAFEEGGMFEDISPDIQDSADALEELVEGILRYDDAVSTLQEKEEEWRDALSDSADFEKRATAMEDLRETYSDFLDLSDDLSDTFVENADNLDLMAEAAAGDVDAYNELLAAASEDIAVHVYGIDETSQDLQTISTYLQSDAFKDIEVGMSLDPEDEAGFYTALNNMIAQGNWTRQDLDSYLKDIDCSLDPSGIEEGLTEAQEAAIAAGETIPENTTYTTTAETDTVQSEDTKEATSLEVTEKPGDTWHADVPTVTVQTAGMPAAISVPIQGTVPPSFEVKAKPIKSVDTQETTGSSMKTEKGGDGKFHLKNGSVKKNNSGGTKHNNASSPHASSPGGSCFIAGTLVTTLTGFKPIEEIQKGDIVLSYNEKIKVNEYSEVLQTMIHDTIEPIYTLHIKDEQLRVTGIHRFLVIDKITCGVPQWVHATDLKVGNWVMFADGSWHVIHKIDINIEHRIVYNFEVSHNHNYYVGHNQILAHNKGKSCFVAGTQISTINGLRVIESIQPNDIVLSYNEQTKCNEYSSVVQTMIHDTKEPIYTLYIQNEQLRVTGIHRFFVTNNIVNGIPEWIAAENLKVGQWVLFADGTWHVIHKIKVNIEQQTVYNFEVSGNHNYYVGRNQVLAHNKGNKGKKSCFVAGTQVSTSLGFKPIETIQPDDVVLSYNEQTGHNEYSSVIQTMIHDTIEPIYTLYVQNEKLRVTGIHRFFITKNILTNTSQWIAAENLKVGDWVLLADGTWHVIWKIEINIEHQTVYNFEVSGNHNYYVGYNQILAHNKGGGKAKTIEQKEKKEHKKDYYEEVNNQLEKTEKVLSKIEKEEDRLIGDKARANQNKQLTLLQKEIDLNNKKLKIQKQELKDVDALITKRDKLAEKTAAKQGVLAFIPDIQLDEDKIISNYEEISKAIDDTHNKLIEKYNTAAKAKNENLTKEIQKTIDKFDKYGEDLLKQAQRHNKLQSEIEETKATLEDLEDQMEDIRIDAYKAAQEALDNLKEIKESAAELDKLFRDFDPNSFMNKFSIDDTPYGDLTESLSKLDNMYSIAKEDANDFYQNLINQKRDAFNKTSDVDEQKAILSSIKFFEEQQSKLTNGANLENGLLGLAQQDLARLQEWIDNPAAKDNPFGKNEAALFEAYQDAYKRTLDYFKDYRELIQDTRDSIIDIYDDASDAIERQIDQFDRLIEKTERISDTYTLYYGEDSYDQLDKFYAQQGNIMQNQLDQLTAAYNYWQEQYQKALQTGDKKFIQEMKDRADEAEDAMLDAAQELAELWVEKFENAVEASSQHIYKNLFGSNDIDELADNWELQKDYMERYKDDVEKAYEIEKLRNKYLDLLDEAQGSSLQTQNKIRQQMQEQLDLLQNETTMSEYDVKLANAKLEILQKQMALEDAQRNKNKMQLRRDTQGNYRYVYTADQGDVRQAQQDLEDSEYDAYEMTKEETVANNDRAINLLQDYIEKRAAIWNKYKDDATARGQALAELEAEYEKIFLTLAEDFTDTSEGMYDILNWLVKNGSEDTTTAAINMLDTLYDKNGEIKEKTGQDWADMASFISNQVLPNIGEAVTRANLEMEDQATELKDAMVGSDGVLTKIGSGADDVKDSMDKAADATRLLANATDELFTAFGADDGKLQKALDKLAQYEQQLQNTQKTTSNLAGQLKQANQTIAAKNAEALHYQTTLDLLTGARNFKKGDTVTLKKGTWVWYARDEKQRDDKGNHGFALPEDTEIKIGSTEEKDSDGKLSKHHIGMRPTDTKVWGKPVADDPRKGGSTSNRKQQVWHLNPDEIIKAMKYDTGGYTGKWQDQTEDVKNGKLAVLHQKELILNATDTENILAAVTLMRDMTKGSILGLSNIGKIIPTGLSSNIYGSTTEQRVEIQASFPNATDAEDIRAALLGLSDSAYQYAHRTI